MRNAEEAYAAANAADRNSESPEAIWASSSSGNIEIAFALEDADAILQPGDAEPAVTAIMAQPYMREQLAKISADDARDELREYGAWEETDLADHDTNLMRLVWLMGSSAMEEHMMRDERA